MGISGGEILFIILIILMLFGADKIPELIRSFGKGMYELKKAADEIKREITDDVGDLRSEVMDIRRDIEIEAQQMTYEVKKNIEGYEPYEQIQSETPIDDNTSPQPKLVINHDTLNSDSKDKSSVSKSASEENIINYDI